MVNAPLNTFKGFDFDSICILPIFVALLLVDFIDAENAVSLKSTPDSLNLPVGTTNPSVYPLRRNALP